MGYGWLPCGRRSDRSDCDVSYFYGLVYVKYKGTVEGGANPFPGHLDDLQETLESSRMENEPPRPGSIGSGKSQARGSRSPVSVRSVSLKLVESGLGSAGRSRLSMKRWLAWLYGLSESALPTGEYLHYHKPSQLPTGLVICRVGVILSR